MNTLNIYPFCEALATGLLHSLWLFPLLAGIDRLVAGLLPRSRDRYQSHLITLITCLAAFLGVVSWHWWTITWAWSDASFLQMEVGASLASQLTDGFQKLGLSTAANWTIYLALAYTIGLLIVLVRYIGRYRSTLYVRKGGLLPAPDQRALFTALKEEVYPQGRTDWRITDRVRNVLVVGVLRPVILFPVGLVNQLTAEEVAVILRHELTHLRRYDPFWNAVQEIILTLFFYHPVIYFLCRELDREREYACDDDVLQKTDPKLYARALLRVANYSSHPKIPLTMAATSTPDFTQRVQRLFSTTEPRPRLPFTNRSPWISVLTVLPLLLVFAYTVANPYQLSAQIPNTTSEITSGQEIMLTGTVVDGDTNEPLIGTTVVMSGTSKGTITNLMGEYEFRVISGTVPLSLSYVGYQSLNIQLLDQKENGTINFKLYRDRKGEVDITNRGAKFIFVERIPYPDGSESASPTRTATATGLKLEGNDKILYLIDGEKKEDTSLETINPQDIESISVFKDKDEIAKFGYGTKYEGVISIKLKKKDKN